MFADWHFWVIPCVVALAGYLASLFLDKIVIPWRARKMAERLLRDLKDGKKPPVRPHKFVIKFDNDGFRLSSVKKPEQQIEMRWIDVQKSEVYKRDLFVYDLICLLMTDGMGYSIELNEEMCGWLNFVQELPQHLRGCQAFDHWVMNVEFPAFETKRAEIFCRKPSGLPSSKVG